MNRNALYLTLALVLIFPAMAMSQATTLVSATPITVTSSGGQVIIPVSIERPGGPGILHYELAQATNDYSITWNFLSKASSGATTFNTPTVLALNSVVTTDSTTTTNTSTQTISTTSTNLTTGATTTITTTTVDVVTTVTTTGSTTVTNTEYASASTYNTSITSAATAAGLLQTDLPDAYETRVQVVNGAATDLTINKLFYLQASRRSFR